MPQPFNATTIFHQSTVINVMLIPSERRAGEAGNTSQKRCCLSLCLQIVTVTCAVALSFHLPFHRYSFAHFNSCFKRLTWTYLLIRNKKWCIYTSTVRETRRIPCPSELTLHVFRSLVTYNINFRNGTCL